MLRGPLTFLLVLMVIVAPVSGQGNPKAAFLEKVGWEALTAGNADSAAEAFRGALAVDPKNARLHLGAGIAAYLERRDEDARSALERALDLDPQLSEARSLLGQVLYRTGDLVAAIRMYEKVVAAAPNDERSGAVLERWRREWELHDRMQQSLNERFTVRFEGPEEAQLAQRVLAALDRAYWRIGESLGAFPNRPVTVVLYTTEQFRDVTRSPPWAAAAYDGTIRVPIRGALGKETELDRVLSHEYAHALVRVLAARNVPTWLNEGVATAFEADGDLAWANERVRRAGAGIPFDSLRTSFGRFSGDEAQLAYATSALAVRRMLDEMGGVAIANLLRDLGEGLDFATAFAHRIQRPFTDWSADR